MMQSGSPHDRGVMCTTATELGPKGRSKEEKPVHPSTNIHYKLYALIY